MSHGTNGAGPPSRARQLRVPAALALADLAAIFDELQFVLRCCERLLTELTAQERDDVLVESLWISTLVSYARCFRPGERGMGLSGEDVTGTGLKGDVMEWHSLLGRLRDFYVEGAANPREAFLVGASQSQNGEAEGLVISSATQPQVDQATVQQTGRLAFELSRVVDERIKKQQRTVFDAVRAMPVDELNALPEMEVGQAVPGEKPE
jgi:hypothetical protein